MDKISVLSHTHLTFCSNQTVFSFFTPTGFSLFYYPTLLCFHIFWPTICLVWSPIHASGNIELKVWLKLLSDYISSSFAQFQCKRPSSFSDNESAFFFPTVELVQTGCLQSVSCFKTFSQPIVPYDDRPHGLICPWIVTVVYRNRSANVNCSDDRRFVVEKALDR